MQHCYYNPQKDFAEYIIFKDNKTQNNIVYPCSLNNHEGIQIPLNTEHVNVTNIQQHDLPSFKEKLCEFYGYAPMDNNSDQNDADECSNLKNLKDIDKCLNSISKEGHKKCQSNYRNIQMDKIGIYPYNIFLNGMCCKRLQIKTLDNYRNSRNITSYTSQIDMYISAIHLDGNPPVNWTSAFTKNLFVNCMTQPIKYNNNIDIFKLDLYKLIDTTDYKLINRIENVIHIFSKNIDTPATFHFKSIVDYFEQFHREHKTYKLSNKILDHIAMMFESSIMKPIVDNNIAEYAKVITYIKTLYNIPIEECIKTNPLFIYLINLCVLLGLDYIFNNIYKIYDNLDIHFLTNNVESYPHDASPELINMKKTLVQCVTQIVNSNEYLKFINELINFIMTILMNLLNSFKMLYTMTILDELKKYIMAIYGNQLSFSNEHNIYIKQTYNLIKLGINYMFYGNFNVIPNLQHIIDDDIEVDNAIANIKNVFLHQISTITTPVTQDMDTDPDPNIDPHVQYSKAISDTINYVYDNMSSATLSYTSATKLINMAGHSKLLLNDNKKYQLSSKTHALQYIEKYNGKSLLDANASAVATGEGSAKAKLTAGGICKAGLSMLSSAKANIGVNVSLLWGAVNIGTNSNISTNANINTNASVSGNANMSASAHGHGSAGATANASINAKKSISIENSVVNEQVESIYGDLNNFMKSMGIKLTGFDDLFATNQEYINESLFKINRSLLINDILNIFTIDLKNELLSKIIFDFDSIKGILNDYSSNMINTSVLSNARIALLADSSVWNLSNIVLNEKSPYLQQQTTPATGGKLNIFNTYCHNKQTYLHL